MWIAALGRAGADPLVGRKLPGVLDEAGFRVRVELLDRLARPSPERFALLAGLPLSPEEDTRRRQAEAADAAVRTSKRCAAEPPDAACIAHLPIFLITAEKPPLTR